MNNNNTDNDINKYIEETVEKKFNSVIETIIDNKVDNRNKMIYEYTVSELYQNTLQTIIDIINDLSNFFSINHKNLNNQEYRTQLFDIFLKDNRKLYTGIIFIILSLIFYFVDSSSI
jgi:hypothetical protein